MATQATYDDANLILRLYELRREPTLREARAWFGANFTAKTPEEAMKLGGPGSKEGAYVRMVVSYWDMVASFVTAGVLNQDLLFQSAGEMLVVWERIRELTPGFRAMMKNPGIWQNLETVGNAYIQYMAAKGPDAYPAFQEMLKSMGAGQSA
jgi:hypothetical protein